MRARDFIFEDIDKQKLIKLDRITRKLKSDPDLIDEIFKQISVRSKGLEGQFKNRFVAMLDPDETAPETDQTFANFLRVFAEIITSIDAPIEDKFQFIGTLGKTSHINTKALLSTSKSSWDDWLTGSDFSKQLFHAAFGHPGLTTDNKGPGEAALAILSPQITLSTAKGDIIVDGVPVEVKAGNGKGKSAGRLSTTAGDIGSLDKNWFKQNIFIDNPELIKSWPDKIVANRFGELVGKFKLSTEQIFLILTNVFKHSGVRQLAKRLANKGSNITGAELVGLSIHNYGLSQGDEHFLILIKSTKSSLYFTRKTWRQAMKQGLSGSLYMFGSGARTAGQTQLSLY